MARIAFPCSRPKRLPACIVAGTVFAWLACAGSANTAPPIVPAASDPATILCKVDDAPITHGDLTLLLKEQNQKDPSAAVRIASVQVLIQRELALRSLKELGGAALAQVIQQRTEEAERTAAKRGLSLDDQAAQLGCDGPSLHRKLAWQAAWASFLRSRLNDTNLRRYFARHHSRYDGTKLRLSQIFLTPDPSTTSPNTPAEKLERLAKDLRALQPSAEPFATAAKEHSQSPSRDRGGEIGWIEAYGDVPPAVSEAVWSAEPGSIIGPVESPLGFHLLYVHERQAGEKTIDEIADQTLLRSDAASDLFQALVQRQPKPEIEWVDTTLQPPEL
ncbi:Chaperone SurA precursor [Roseimaritima multifibrata]|uniref:Chaperone SurA n=1 Tax=Roseimaritima multifibrata TaxID=1930274 RepID=A0A517MNF1_9BACT|nr:peptidylprolyl isomerase [Roseimaritima multifibrata]QDS96418.1 Chaperone SurA precursor [Roseimaritima multifibrata]